MGEDLLFGLISLCLVVFAGLMSGLTLGLMSQDKMDLQVLQRSGNPVQQRYATMILPVIERPHFTLVTLLLCNAIALEALPVLLNRIMHEATAVALSVTVVLLFGEIIPQAACCRYGLVIGAHSAWLVRLLRFLTFPISWPISKCLDWLIGSDRSAIFKRAELKEFVNLHSKQEGLEGGLTEEEVRVISGALDMEEKKIKKAMTPIDKVFAISNTAVVDKDLLKLIIESGHSRIPVYSENNKLDIVGLLLVKELISIDVNAGIAVKDISLRSIPFLPAHLRMYDALTLFKTGRSHMAVLSEPRLLENQSRPTQSPFEQATKGHPIGIVTIEDLIEELLQVDIVDETDRFIDNLQQHRVTATTRAAIPPHLRRFIPIRSIASREPETRPSDSVAGGDERSLVSIPLLQRGSNSSSRHSNL